MSRIVEWLKLLFYFEEKNFELNSVLMTKLRKKESGTLILPFSEFLAVF